MKSGGWNLISSVTNPFIKIRDEGLSFVQYEIYPGIFLDNIIEIFINEHFFL